MSKSTTKFTKILKWAIGIPVGFILLLLVIGIFAPKDKAAKAVDNTVVPAKQDVTDTPKENLSDDVTEENFKAYEMMHQVFIGNPDTDELKTLFRKALPKYKLDVNEDNLQKVGSALLELRKSSNVGVTEIEILRNVVDQGSDKLKITEQLGISATLLEEEKKPK